MSYEQPELFEMSDRPLWDEPEFGAAAGLNTRPESLYWDMANRRQDQGVANAFTMNADPDAVWPEIPTQRKAVEDQPHWQPQSVERIQACRKWVSDISEMLEQKRQARRDQQ